MCCPLTTASSRFFDFAVGCHKAVYVLSVVLETVGNWYINCQQRECGHNPVTFPLASSHAFRVSQVQILDPIFLSTRPRSIHRHWAHTACITLHHLLDDVPLRNYSLTHCAIYLVYIDEASDDLAIEPWTHLLTVLSLECTLPEIVPPASSLI